MAYRVGYQCFATSESAHDYLLSQQAPIITAEGKVLRPIKQGEHWYLQGQKITLSFPPCNIAEQISMGLIFSLFLLVLVLTVFCFKQIKALIQSLSSVGADND